MITDDFELFEKRKVLSELDLLFNNNNKDMLSEVASFMKLNYNCPDSEKVGSGPGSCSGGKTPTKILTPPTVLRKSFIFTEKSNFRDPISDMRNESDSIKYKNMLIQEYKQRQKVSSATEKIKTIFKTWEEEIDNARMEVAKHYGHVPVEQAIAIANKFDKLYQGQIDKLSDSRAKAKIEIEKIHKDVIQYYGKSQLRAVFDMELEERGYTGQFIVNEYNNGISVYRPKNPEVELPSQHEVFFEIMRLPKLLTDKTFRIVLMDKPNPDDSKWKEKYGIDFSSAGTAGGNDKTIHIYMQKKVEAESLIAHEAAHNLDRDWSNPTIRKNFYSEGEEWNTAMALDTPIKGKKYISDYSEMRQENCEDYAESVERYLNIPNIFKEEAPHRYNILENQFKNGIKNHEEKLSKWIDIR